MKKKGVGKGGTVGKRNKKRHRAESIGQRALPNSPMSGEGLTVPPCLATRDLRLRGLSSFLDASAVSFI